MNLDHDLGRDPEPRSDTAAEFRPGGPGWSGESRRNRWLRAGAVAAVVTAGGLGGLALGSPSTSSAQTAADGSATDDTADSTTDSGPGGHFHGPRRGGLDAAAEALGLTAEELRTALGEDGATLATIAAAQGVELQTLIDAMVADATSDLDAAVEAGDLDETRATEIKANLVDRITAMVNGEMGPGGHGGDRGPGGRGGPGGGRHLDTAAEVLGLEVDALGEQLEGGSTLAEIAEAEGVDVDTLIDALVDDARERITAMVNGEVPEPSAADAEETATA